MTIQNGQLVDEAVTNSAFLSKTDITASNTAIAKIGLANVSESDSGPAILNIQKRLNDNKFITSPTETVSASSSITASLNGNQYLRVVGDAGAVTVSDEPFGTGSFDDGKIIRLVGTDNTNTVKILNKDISKGAVLNGEALLKKYYVLELMYDSVLDRFIEIGRNWA